MYDYIGHLKQFGFDWIQNNLGLRYGIRTNNTNSKKIKKQLTLSRTTRKKKKKKKKKKMNSKKNSELIHFHVRKLQCQITSASDKFQAK